LLLLQRK